MGGNSGKTTFSFSVPGSQLELTEDGSPEETFGPKDDSEKDKNSGPEDPTKYNVDSKNPGTEEDPTKYNLDSKKTPDTSKNTPKPISYASSAVPPQHPAITSQRADNLGYRDTGSLWRKAALSLPYGEKAKFKAEQIREFQYSSYNIPDAKDPSNTREVAEVEKLRKQVIDRPIIDQDIESAINVINNSKSKAEVIDKLDNINPNLLGFIEKAMDAQFARGKGGFSKALLSFSDVSSYTGQWLDRYGNFENREMIDVLKAAQFYNLKELVVDGDSTILYKQKIENGTVVNDFALTKSSHDPKNGQVNYSLESNSVEAVIALADQIANNRQGNTNFIKLETMGDDAILFLVLARTLTSQHGMQIGIDPRLKQQVDAELKSLNNPKLIKEWDDIYSKKMEHHYYDVRQNRPHDQWQQPEKVTRLMEIVEKITPPKPAPPVGGVAVTATTNSSVTPNSPVVGRASPKQNI